MFTELAVGCSRPGNPSTSRSANRSITSNTRFDRPDTINSPIVCRSGPERASGAAWTIITYRTASIGFFALAANQVSEGSVLWKTSSTERRSSVARSAESVPTRQHRYNRSRTISAYDKRHVHSTLNASGRGACRPRAHRCIVTGEKRRPEQPNREQRTGPDRQSGTSHPVLRSENLDRNLQYRSGREPA